MPVNPERSGCRFIVTKTDEGKPLIQLELFHNTVPSLKSLIVGFEVLTGTTPDQAKSLADAMNERIIGVNVTPQG
jgi:hypothetical protein